MVPQSSDIYPLTNSRVHLDRIDASFGDYLKLRSIVWLLRFGARSTEGVVVANSSETSIRVVSDYARSRGWNRFLLRHDSRSGRPRTLQGGFLIDVEEIAFWVDRFVHDGICILLEPLDPIRNGYNVSCLADQSSDLIEILGPGFDASDLQRGFITPHETCFCSIEAEQFGSRAIVTRQDYLFSVEQRLRKIWWKFCRRELDTARWRELSRVERHACKQLIRKVRGTAIASTYEPIPEEMFDQYLTVAVPLISAWRKEGHETPAVFAGSFVQDGSFCFWDVNTSKRWTG
jgi:hypothetical protein